MDPHQPDLFADELPSEAPPTPRQALAPTVAVLAVAVAAIAAAVMSHRGDPPASGAQSRLASSGQPAVVTAPPLSRSPAQAMGASPVCSTCGVVESVAVAAPSKSFKMRIRMDDGTMRTVEQRGALPAGSRVALSGDSLKLIPG